MKKINVLISDFQFLTRAGLIHLISERDEFELVGVVDGAEELMTNVLTNHPDVLLMDYQSKDPVLQSLLGQVVKANATNVLIITNEDKREHIKPLIDMGIKGIVTKKCSQNEILNAIESVSKNSRFYCNRILDLLIDDSQDKAEDCEPTDLSPREYEVLQLITKGHKTAQIADELNVSVHTINSHRKNILKKLNLKSPTELIVYALETGLVKA
ncbi:response regulator transcription factor [Marinoscillum furvescens]|uniref:DNA-binding NarL/FixJ family response regulator n=1 Tax=Marinoscillum furvescens DSM 4134 TaxID=1122208 RepID=A0A3D9L486_MARFU|nr:response regulator transcription factor [Marinoscillum furvescens]REE00435.1 DNA-binding NarL/FixJ family response regulator [Marinoscillum furvescens DSM 4134]